MGIIRFEKGVLTQIHDAFTVPFAGTGLEIHGTNGSLFAREVMTQRATGEITLRMAGGTTSVEVMHHDLYVTSVAHFHRAVNGVAEPAATGTDGYRSLVTALTLAKSAESGDCRRVPSGLERSV